MVLALVALLAAVVLFLLLTVLRLETENRSALADKELSEVALQSARTQLSERSFLAEQMINRLGRQLREKSAETRIFRLAPPAGSAPGPAAVVICDLPDALGLAAFTGLPPCAPEKEYRLWVVDAVGGKQLDAGAVCPAGDGRAATFFPLSGAVGSATVTLESREPHGAPKGPSVLETRL